MLFYLTVAVLGLACSIITIRTLVGYTDFKRVYKIIISTFIVLGWFSIIIVRFLKSQTFLPDSVYALISTALYSLQGFLLILFIVIMMRDAVWYMVYYILKLMKIDAWYIDPKNLSLLNVANLLVVIVALILSIFAFRSGYKDPNIITETIYSDRISRNLRIVQISDLNISRTTSINRISSLVSKVNMLNPDIIVITGDTISDNIKLIQDKIAILASLSASYGVYSIMGEQEFYNDVYEAKKMFEDIGIKFLFNGGYFVANSNIYITGVPDLTTMFERINLWRSIKDTQKSDFRILLSHHPLIIDSLNKELYDVVLSGHTMGGQVFPLHFIAMKTSNYLAGKYKVNDIDLVVSRGVGTMGPPMRFLAPSDIIVIDLYKK